MALVDANVDAKGTRKVAEAYLEFLYSPEGQELVAKHYYRPIEAGAGRRRTISPRFPKIELFTHRRPVFGGWKKAQATHFADGGIFDQIYKPSQLTMAAGRSPCGLRYQAAQRHPGLRAGAGLTPGLSEPDRPDPAGGAVPAHGRR